MVFTHDTEMALQAAVTLANSRREPDTLTPSPTSTRSTTSSRYTGRHDARPGPSSTAVRAIRAALRELLTADRDEAVELVNEMLRRAPARSPSWSATTSWDWHLHAVDDRRPLADRIVVETAMAMIDVIRADEMSRLGVCADDTCDGVVLDLSRNRSRRFCSTTCGNRNAVAAYRARSRPLAEPARLGSCHPA